MTLIYCPQCAEHGETHIIGVCDVCQWPPALDGRCLCDLPEEDTDD